MDLDIGLNDRREAESARPAGELSEEGGVREARSTSSARPQTWREQCRAGIPRLLIGRGGPLVLVRGWRLVEIPIRTAATNRECAEH